MQARQGDGATLRQHLQRLRRNTGRVDARLTVQLPVAAAVLWEVYCGLAGPEPMRWVELHAWTQTQGVQLSGWEIDTLVAMDRVMHARLQEQARAKSEKPTAGQR